MTGVTSKFCEERNVSQIFTRELVSFNFPVTTKNVLLSINLCLAVKFPRPRLFILVVFSKENKHSERIAEAIMSLPTPTNLKGA